MIKRIKYILPFIAILLFLCSCSSNEQTVELDEWKDKLIQPSETTVENPIPEIKENAEGKVEDAAAVLGDITDETYNTAKNWGETISDTIKGWWNAGTQSVANKTNDILSKIQEKQEYSEGSRIKVELIRVVDGDTIVVEYENEHFTVRLIGINTPESVHPDADKNTAEGIVASEFLKEYLTDTEDVWLEFDKDLNDSYGRVLAYVWLNEEGTVPENDMLNVILVKLGFAEPMTVGHNTKFKEEIAAAAVEETTEVPRETEEIMEETLENSISDNKPSVQ